MRSFGRSAVWLGAAASAALLLADGRAAGYIEAAYSLGKLIGDSTNVLEMRLEKLDKQKNLLIYRKVRDIKGTHKGEEIKHDIGTRGFHPREWQTTMAWAEVGRMALFFHNGGAGECCIDGYWYQVYAGDWWGMSHAEPYLLRTYSGKPEKLSVLVQAMLTGQEVLAPCLADGDKNALQLRKGRLQRMKASLKIQDYNPARDFAGWGVEEFRAIGDMPGFSHYAPVAAVGPGAGGVAVADIDGDGKPDVCLYGATRMALLQNGGGSLNEVPLGLTCGARAAAWADFNADGRPDLLLATPFGPRLYANEGKGTFKDVTAGLPAQSYWSLQAAEWIDYDGDKRPDILLADAFQGLRLYRNRTGDPPASAPAVASAKLLFEDVSDKVGLGAGGLAANLKGDHLAVADVNGDGRPDFLYSAATGVLAINTPQGFVQAKDCGVAYRAGGVAPAFGDYSGDKSPDLFIPQTGACKLLLNDGKGRFADVTAKAGALAAPIGQATCAVWADFDARGRLDLLVGCLKGPNRYFRNNGDGTFADATDQIGLTRRIFNTRGMSVADINKDNVPDLVMNNEGQESAILLGNPIRPAPAAPPKP